MTLEQLEKRKKLIIIVLALASIVFFTINPMRLTSYIPMFLVYGSMMLAWLLCGSNLDAPTVSARETLSRPKRLALSALLVACALVAELAIMFIDGVAR